MASRHKVVSSRRWEELHEELAESSAESSRLRTMYIATLQELSTAHQDAKSECIQAARLAVDERRRENKAVYEHNMRVEMAKAFEEGRQCQVGPMFGKDFEKTLELHDAYNILHEEQRSCFAAEREAKLLRVKLERSSADNRRHEEEAARNGKLEQEVESLRGKLEALKIAVKVEEVARSVQGQLVDMKQDDTTNDVPMELELPVSEAAMQVESPVPEAMVEEPASKEPATTEPASKEPASKEPAQDLAEFYASIGVVSQLGQRMQPPFEPTSTFKRLDPTSVVRLAREVANGHTISKKPLHPLAAKKLELNRHIVKVEKSFGALQGQMSFTMLEVCKMWVKIQKPVEDKPSSSSSTLELLRTINTSIDNSLAEHSGHSKEHAEMVQAVLSKVTAVAAVAKERHRKKTMEENEAIKAKFTKKKLAKEAEQEKKRALQEAKRLEKAAPLMKDVLGLRSSVQELEKTLINTEKTHPDQKLERISFAAFKAKAETEYLNILEAELMERTMEWQRLLGDIPISEDSSSSSSAVSGSDSDSDSS